MHHNAFQIPIFNEQQQQSERGKLWPFSHVCFKIFKYFENDLFRLRLSERNHDVSRSGQRKIYIFIEREREREREEERVSGRERRRVMAKVCVKKN